MWVLMSCHENETTYALDLRNTCIPVGGDKEVQRVNLSFTPFCILPSHMEWGITLPPDFFFSFLSASLRIWPWPMVQGPGPITIWKNFINQICSRTISENYTAPEAYRKHAPGTVCTSNMVLEHIWLKKFFQIINGLDHESRPKSPKSSLGLASIIFLPVLIFRMNPNHMHVIL